MGDTSLQGATLRDVLVHGILMFAVPQGPTEEGLSQEQGHPSNLGCLCQISFAHQTQWWWYSSKMGGPHSPDILSLYRTFNPLTSTRLCPYYNEACNGHDQLLNHLKFHYCIVLVCPICASCGSSSWRTVKGHIKACALQRPNIAG